MVKGRKKRDKVPSASCKRDMLMSYKKDNDAVSLRNFSDHDGSGIEDYENDDDDDDDDIQISLAPYIQTYLAQSSQKIKCCGINLPVLFERAATTSWWNFKFDSDILERQYKTSAFCQIRLRFRYCLYYMLLVSTTWCLYLMYNNAYNNNDSSYYQLNNVNNSNNNNNTQTFLEYPYNYNNLDSNSSNRRTVTENYILFILLFSLFSLITIFILLFTRSRYYIKYQLFISILTCVIMFTLSLLCVFNDRFSIITLSGHFSLFLQLLILIYTIIPLPLYLYITLTIIYTILFDYFSQSSSLSPSVLVRLLYYICVHLIGIHILVMTSVRMRGTFMKVGQLLLVRRQLELEKQLKEKMIHSVMPPKVAAWLMTECKRKGDYSDNEGEDNDEDNNDKEEEEDDDDEEEEDYDDNSSDCNEEERISFNAKSCSDIRSLFRPFNMHHMENVSILFADIVGFTKMSSNKNASQLVAILNELFERFDELCLINCCEKISTLGDCYYCVSGCPEPRSDHAMCCVEMGLSMINAISDFERVSNEGVNMRVGIHTGTVLCGILGTKRVKFDVWSNDVTLANRMESTGRPGQVHLSETTRKFLDDRYVLDEGEVVNDLKTYFVKGRKQEEEICTADNEISYSNVEQPILSNNNDNMQTILSPIVNLTTELKSINILKDNTLSTPSSPIENKLVINYKTEDDNNKKYENFTIDRFLLRNKIDNVHSSTGILNSNTVNNSINKICRNCNRYSDNDSNISCHSLPALLNLNENITTSQKFNNLLKFNTISGNRSNKHNDRQYPSSNITSTSASINNNPTVATVTISGPQSCNPASPGVKLKLLEPPNEYSKIENTVRKDTDCTCIQWKQQKHQIHQQYQRPIFPQSLNDETSVCLSINSRKDSGVRSSCSRRSSIQHQLYGLMQGEQFSRRVSLSQSGYYTSSQFTINENNNSDGDSDNADHENNMEGNSDIGSGGSKHLAICLQKLRKQSDLQLIRCVQDNSVSQQSYFVHPPLSKFTLFFKQNKLEKEYRKKVHRHNTGSTKRSSEQNKNVSHSSKPLGNFDMSSTTTLATARVNTFLDITISFLVFALTAIILSVTFTVTLLWLIILVILTLVYILAIMICFYNVKYRVKLKWTNKLLDWYPWHIFGAILVSMPIVLIIFNFIESIDIISSVQSIHQFTSLIFIGLIHFCNFTQLNCWMKNLLATLFSLIYVLLIISYFSASNSIIPPITVNNSTNLNNYDNNNNNNTSLFELFNFGDNLDGSNKQNDDFNSTVFTTYNSTSNCTESTKEVIQNIEENNLTITLPPSNHCSMPNQSLENNLSQYKNITVLNAEHIIMGIWFNIVLLLILIWILNREFEISYRLSFHSDTLATRDKRKVQQMKEQADCLLNNIIPQHVAEHLKNTARYSETVKNAGIVFASIVNFSEMYDESYLGGRECLRVLNELVSDFDELLNHEQFSMVEKIKTIGSTYMAASGLTGSSVSTEHGHTANNDMHLHQLMEFALALQQVVNTFNSHLLEFNLILRVGYNSGDIVAGVIGTTKLHYDIWGDAVNIASRMDSTGVPGKIQVPSECLHVLTRWYQFTPRGSVYVKGKDHMNTYLLTDRKLEK